LRPRIASPLLLAVALLAGCGDVPTPEEQAAEAARRIALVEKGNSALPPLEEVYLEPISYADVERHNLTGAGCNFAPGNSFGTRVVARPVDAHMKIGEDVIRLAADAGASELPAGARSRYLSGTHEMRLEVSGEGKPSAGGSDKVDYLGTVTLVDEHGRLVYQASGLAQCAG
jgi:hypothetical protein